MGVKRPPNADLLLYLDGIIDIDTEVANGTLDLGEPKQETSG
jgi:hypothetical protein